MHLCEFFYILNHANTCVTIFMRENLYKSSDWKLCYLYLHLLKNYNTFLCINKHDNVNGLFVRSHHYTLF